jgi:hypothetical protein
MRLRGGICSDRPRGRKAERCGVLGLSIAVSSCDLRPSDSRNFMAGDRVGGPASDKLRALGGDRGVVVCSLLAPTSSALVSSFASILARISMPSWSLAMMRRDVADIWFGLGCCWRRHQSSHGGFKDRRV